MRSKMMPMVALSVTEAKLFAAVMAVQDILFIMRIIESMGLRVKKLMVLEIDNKGAKDLVNNWSVGGRLRHVEEGLIVVKCVSIRTSLRSNTVENLPAQQKRTKTNNNVSPSQSWGSPLFS
jgi:hypothetical protein